MAFSTTPLVGIDLNRVITAAEITSTFGGSPPFKTGLRVDGSDGKQYVFAKCAATTISASDTDCALSLSSGVWVAANSGGTYTSPATAMASGDYGWFSKASVIS